MALLEDLRREAANPAGRARALPFRAYSDPEVFELERERIFHRDWIAVCPEAALAEAGDYMAFDLAGEPVVVIRGQDGELRALSNVCRHRGTVLLDEGMGNASKFLCPYHAWSYDTTGRLTGVPYPGNVKIDKRAHCLPRFSLDRWAGAVFVNLDPEPEPLSQRLAGIDRCLKNFQLDRYEVPGGRGETRIWNANWKVVLENAMESYHLFRVHAPTFEAIAPTSGAFYLEGSARWTLTAGRVTRGTRPRPEDPATIGEFERENYVLVSIPPTMVGIVSRDSWGWLSVLPIAPDKSLLGGGSLTPRGVKSRRSEGGDSGFFEATMEEDRLICERNQTGMRSRGARGGQLVELERVVVDFHQYLAWRLFDHEPDKHWASPAAEGF